MTAALFAQAGAFALKHWKWLALAAMAIALAVQGSALERARKDLRNPATGAKWQAEAERDGKALARAVGDLGTCRDTAAQLKASLASQNAAVDRWKAEGEARAAEAGKAARDARSARAVAESRAQQLAALASAETCPGREANMRTMVEGLSR